jgi:phospholipase C
LDRERRRFLELAAGFAGGAVAYAALPSSIRRALALPALSITGTIADVQHIVILMQENRSFDHYFGTLRGVRGFRDRYPVPLASGKQVWHQSDGEKEIPPYHLDSRTSSALQVPDTPHSFADAQAAWAQGQFGFWPKFKTPYSMGYYRRDDIPFQFALADAFTVCDAHHCSVTTGTDPNRIAFWSGSNFDPERRERGENCTDADSEPDNLRCWIKGALPTPGYTYQGSAFTWPTIPDVLEGAGISWRIYQDPNDNWTGAMHGGLAFASFRNAAPGSALYRQGMTHWSLEQFADEVRTDALPRVSWILPPKLWSEHPAASSPPQGAEFIARVLNALTANPNVWGKTAFFLTFDENDGFFDHVPPPAPPSYSSDGTLAGKSTLDLRGMYFADPEGKHLEPSDRISGRLRPWGLGARVPLYVISPWSRGGWVDSQVFDHTSVGRFIEKRFGVTIPAISPWHRAICGDLTSAFDFRNGNQAPFPQLPSTSGSISLIGAISQRPKPTPPIVAAPPFQESGVRRSRPLAYDLSVQGQARARAGEFALTFHNRGELGAVFHVYDRLRLDRIPRRYSVEARKSLSDVWNLENETGRYDLCIYAPNGFVRGFAGRAESEPDRAVEIALEYMPAQRSVRLVAMSERAAGTRLTVRSNAYRTDGPWAMVVPQGRHIVHEQSLIGSHNWYDLTTTGECLERHFAGRLENGAPGFSDPAV